MKALVYNAPGTMTLQELAMPQPGPEEVLVKIDCAGICGSDMHAFFGHDPRRQPPLLMGHEFSGSIAEGPEAGKRITGNPSSVCGSCSYCVQGRENLCQNRSMVGMTRPGAFAEYMAIQRSSIIAIPAELDLATAALTEPGATALHAVNLAFRHSFRPLPENRVLVIGGGAIGLLCALLLRHYGVRKLAIVETNVLRMASLQKAIDCPILNPPTETGCWDLVFDCVGGEKTRERSLAAVAAGGLIVHVGLQAWASEIDLRRLTLQEISLLGSFTYTFADLEATIAALLGGVFGPCDNWLESWPLLEGVQAFAELAAQNVAASKILLRS